MSISLAINTNAVSLSRARLLTHMVCRQKYQLSTYLPERDIYYNSYLIFILCYFVLFLLDYTDCIL